MQHIKPKQLSDHQIKLILFIFLEKGKKKKTFKIHSQKMTKKKTHKLADQQHAYIWHLCKKVEGLNYLLPRGF